MVLGGFGPQQRSRPKFNDNDKQFVYERQKGICRGCKQKLPIKTLEMDHIVPISRGGSDKPSNLQLLCRSCNGSKGDGTQANFERRLKAGKVKGAEKAATKATTTAKKATAKPAAKKKATAKKPTSKKPKDPFADLFG